MIIPFQKSEPYSIGVELEFQLISTNGYDLTPKAPDILKQVPERYKNNFKPEFIQSMLEVVTGVCSNISEISSSLKELCKILETFTLQMECMFHSTSLHPFATLEQRKISKNKRYFEIMDELQIVGRRLITQGLHVHIGLTGKERVIDISNKIRQYLPILLALTGSSPFFLGEDTGFSSYRTILFNSLPRTGVPPTFKNYSAFETLIDTLIQSGSIDSVREIWWDVRPHPDFGTIEVRVCDIPSTFNEIIAITAVIQSLVATLDQSESHLTDNPVLIRHNMWQAARHGLKGKFISERQGETINILEAAEQLIYFIEPCMRQLGAHEHTNIIESIFSHGNSADKQRNNFKKYYNYEKVISNTQEGFWC